MTRRIKPQTLLAPSLLGCLPLLLMACDGGGSPTLQPIADQSAEVGVELNVELTASDPDGDSLVFSVSSESLADLTTRARPPTFVPFGVGSAYLRWTPLASDVGSHTFTVSVSDGKKRASRAFLVTVTAGNGVPVFREPLGSGTTLDLSQGSCVEVDVLVDDPDSPQVDLYLEEPLEDGFQLNQDGAMAATFTWCPSAKQIEGSERYTLNLAADDRTGHIGRKKYVIVIRRELGPSCPGDAPVITHTAPGLQQTVLNIPIAAQITDDLGLSGSPVLYYSLAAPLNPAQPDFSQFVQLTMRRTSGSAQDGQYLTEIPNPVLADPDGTRRTVYYFIEATDDDDPEGTCDHRTRAPAADVFQVEVERQSSGSGLTACAVCLGDAQCLSGRCAVLGGGGTAYCLDPCTTAGAACSGGTCSPAPLTSLGGVTGLLCLPPGSTCQTTCADDAYEPNDSLTDPGVQALGAGQYNNLRLCGDDQDFYGILLDSAAQVTATLLFDHDDGDIDLKLLSETGATLASSMSVTDNEQVSLCLEPGLYFLRTFTFDWDVSAPYSLVITIPPGGCCIDDSLEQNDGALEAMPLDSGDLVEDLQICPDDRDWFSIVLAAGARVVVDVLFDQNTFEQDLDVYLYGPDGVTNLTPCCDSQNGQSGTSDEHLEYTVSTAGTYFIVVEGYDGSSNAYWIGVDVVPPGSP